MSWCDIALICVVEFHCWRPWTEKSSQHNIELCVCEAVFRVSVLAALKTIECAYFIPRQFREPLEKGTRLRCIDGVTFPGSHRSGTNSKGCRNTLGSVCWQYADIPIGICDMVALAKSDSLIECQGDKRADIIFIWKGQIRTPAGIVHCLNCSDIVGDTRGILCDTP